MEGFMPLIHFFGFPHLPQLILSPSNLFFFFFFIAFTTAGTAIASAFLTATTLTHISPLEKLN
jgi:hypothetical protein